MDSTAKLIVWVLGIMTFYKLIDRFLKIKETKLQLMKNREISDIDLGD